MFSRALKIGILMGSVNPNLKKYELKIHRGIICHDNEALHKIWKGTNLSFPSWHEKFHEFWPEHLKGSKILILIGSFWAKYILFELKKYRGVICRDNEELRKIWRGTDLSFQSWHEECEKFWPEHSKVSKIFTLIVSFWEKYILFELKKYRGVIFHEIEEGSKIWRGTDLSFQNWHKEFNKFSPEHSKVSKLELWWDPIAQSRKCMALNLQRSYVS